MNTDKHSDRFVCTIENPWTADKGPAVHPSAFIDGGCYEGCCDDYKCPICGITWRYENPQ